MQLWSLEMMLWKLGDGLADARIPLVAMGVGEMLKYAYGNTIRF